MALLALAAALAAPALALDVEEVRWGFDGSVVPERVNLLSVLVSNPTGEPFASAIELQKEDGVGGRLGAILAADCYVAPFTSRWVQFYPYVAQESETWTLKLAPRDVHRLSSPRVGPPGVVCLTERVGGLTVRGGARAFPAELFPSTVCATDGLRAVVLGHAPRWEPVRRQALTDWLVRGGVLHLCTGDDGEFPQFGTGLELLNDPRPRYRAGAGLVVRHDRPAALLSAAEIAAAAGPVPQLDEGEGYGWLQFEGIALRTLGSIVRPEHNWGVIYLALLVYLLLVVLANFLVARGAKGYARPMAFFVANVLVFSAITGILGRRGYGEREAIHTLAYARSLGGTAWDVTQWTNVFVTRSGQYALTHPGDHNLYATCQQFEPVNAVIRSGLQGLLHAEIPLYSSRGFLHRGRMEGPDPGLRVKEWGEGSPPNRLVVAIGDSVGATEAWAVHSDRVARLSVAAGELRLPPGGWRPLKVLADGTAKLDPWQYGPYAGMDTSGRPADAERVLTELTAQLLARRTGVAENVQYTVKEPAAPDDCVQLFICAGAPESFGLVGQGLGKELGRVLYHVNLFKPESDDE